MDYGKTLHLPETEFPMRGNLPKREPEILKFWEDNKIYQKRLELRKDAKPFILHDGPPYANGKLHIGHALNKTLKDIIMKYKTMTGHYTRYIPGWDTHGLPIEHAVIKNTGLNRHEMAPLDLRNKCKEYALECVETQKQDFIRFGVLGEWDRPYLTLRPEFEVKQLGIFGEMAKRGHIYKGLKTVYWCTHCETALAEAEIEYAEKKSFSIYVKFPYVSEKKVTLPAGVDPKQAYSVIWTTTPWTLPSNVSLTVNPEVDYIKVAKDGEVYYLCQDLANKVLGEGTYEVLETMKGKDLEYMEYEQLMPFVEVEDKAFFVTCADYVTTEDGTGIVHTAPAFGEDDYNCGRKYKLPVVQPVDSNGKFTATPWEGHFVMEDGLDVEIIKWLAAENKLFSKEKIEHNYPHCWRCGTPLVYYANPSWYIEMTKLRDQLVANNNTVNWYPKFVGEGRFGNWLENVKDWAVSRTRYWGTPLNVWRCECGHTDSVGSRAELAEKAIENIDPATVELHRPYVDDIHITCSECGKPMTRVKEVIDCWFDSGAMPFAQHHYPFENKEKFERLFPADYICEGIDQTRGWFYSLLAISTFVMGKAPYKNVLVNDLVLDKNGKKMSKSKGNTVDPFELFDKYGADALRWYLLYVSPPWTPIRFDEAGLREIQSKFLGTMKNVYNFFTLYANTDDIDPKDFFVEYKDRPELDRWILSKYNSLVKSTVENLEIFEVNRVIRNIQAFLNDDLSNWYIRRSRRRFWATELTEDKKAVYNTTYELLTGLCRLIAPFAPYMSEEMYRDLTGEVSVHLASYPKADESLIDAKLEEKMELTKALVALGRASREDSKIKVRQPVSKVLVDGKYEDVISDVVDLIKEELNVKEVVFAKSLEEYMNFSLKPNFKVLGPVLGAKMKLFAGALAKLNANEVVPKLEAGEKVTVDLDGEAFEFDKEHVLVNIDAKEGFDVAMANNIFVILDTHLTQELIDEGYVREFISKIQQIRKASNFEVLDHIEIEFNSDDEISKAVESFKDYIKTETLAVEIKSVDNASFEKYDLNGHETGINITKK